MWSHLCQSLPVSSATVVEHNSDKVETRLCRQSVLSSSCRVLFLLCFSFFHISVKMLVLNTFVGRGRLKPKQRNPPKDKKKCRTCTLCLGGRDLFLVMSWYNFLSVAKAILFKSSFLKIKLVLILRKRKYQNKNVPKEMGRGGGGKYIILTLSISLWRRVHFLCLGFRAEQGPLFMHRVQPEECSFALIFTYHSFVA